MAARFIKAISITLLLSGWICLAFAEKDSITLPKGTTVEKIAPGHFRFKLPNKRTVEVKEFNPKTGVAGYVSFIDPDPPMKPIKAGNQVVLKTNKKLTRKEAANLKPENYVQIDDEVTWLPATISFQPVALGDPDPPLRNLEKGKVKGLSPQPDPPGRK